MTYVNYVENKVKKRKTGTERGTWCQESLWVSGPEDTRIRRACNAYTEEDRCGV